MMKRMTQKFLALGLSAMMCLSLAACGQDDGGAATGAGSNSSESVEESGKEETKQESSSAPEESGSVPDKVETITLYPKDANISSGVINGYRGEYFASRGFAVEVWAYSDEKTNAILASGDLPDVMYVPVKDLDTMIQGGMLLNLDEYLEQIPHLQGSETMDTALEFVRKYRSAETGSVYALPLGVGENFNVYKYADSSERNAVKLLWDVYEEIGAPKMNSMDDLLDVMEQMLAARPENEDGTLNYGTVLNSGSDSTYFACMTMWYRMQGYLETELPYLLESDMATGTNTSILSKDSLYYKGLKWYNEAYKRGLLDPESINNDRATQMPKTQNGQTMVPSGFLPGWAPNYLEYYIPGTKVYYNGNNPYGDANYVIGINAKSDKLDACFAFLDMLADPDALLVTSSGPEGEFWYADGTDAYFTEAGLKHLETSDMGDFTGFKLENGEELSLWNTPFICGQGAMTSYGDGKGGKRVARSNAWEENNVISTNNETFKKWQETTGYENWQAWLAAEDAFISESPLDYIRTFESLPDDMMQLTVDAIRDKVTTASWKMIYAESEEEFEQLWNQMVTDCEGLGAQDVIDWRLEDIENAKKVRDSLK